jgi:hypothetical protein
MNVMTVNQLKGMVLALADTFVIAAGLAVWARHVDHPELDAPTIASAGLTFALPLGAIIGRVATRDRDRLERILINALVMVVPCALVAWSEFDPRQHLLGLLVVLGAMWAPTCLLAVVLERWTRPPPRIPTCTLYKTLL